MPYLFLFHIGPVQSFIASARRTRDLWFGSQLLSDLSWIAAAYIAENYGHETLIFPSFAAKELHLPATERNVSNKIVALLEPKEDATLFAHAVEQTIKARLNRIKELLYDDIREGIFLSDVMDQQFLEDFFNSFGSPYLIHMKVTTTTHRSGYFWSHKWLPVKAPIPTKQLVGAVPDTNHQSPAHLRASFQTATIRATKSRSELSIENSMKFFVLDHPNIFRVSTCSSAVGASLIHRAHFFLVHRTLQHSPISNA